MREPAPSIVSSASGASGAAGASGASGAAGAASPAGLGRVQGSAAVQCLRVGGSREGIDGDVIVVEEPLELRVGGVPVATLMRTPGSDRELALGFFLTEGWIASSADVGALALCSRPAPDPPPGGAAHGAPAAAPGPEENVADLIAAGGVSLRSPTAAPRLGPATASCGVCGKRTIEEVLAWTPFRGDAALPPGGASFTRRAILRQPALLCREQRLFESTGALHAAGLFDPGGRLLAAEEDVGRHNAVDKVIGWALLEGKLPLSAHALQVSGRVSFEIVQKAYRAGIPLVAAVSGVSSLAVDLAREAGITLVGFLRDGSFTVYAHPERVRE